MRLEIVRVDSDAYLVKEIRLMRDGWFRQRYNKELLMICRASMDLNDRRFFNVVEREKNVEIKRIGTIPISSCAPVCGNFI